MAKGILDFEHTKVEVNTFKNVVTVQVFYYNYTKQEPKMQ